MKKVFADVLAIAGGSILLGAQFGWKVGLAVWCIAVGLSPNRPPS